MEETCLLSMRCPVYRRRDSNPGSCSELETLVGDAKGKGASGETMRPKVPMRCPGADCSIVALNRGNARGAKGAGHPRWDPFWVNGQPEELTGLDGKAAAFDGWHEPDKSRDLRPVVCPGKASVFSRRQTCRGRSQSPVVWIAEERKQNLRSLSTRSPEGRSRVIGPYQKRTHCGLESE